MTGKVDEEKRLSKDIKQFIQFLSSIWGLFASVSIFFPFINQLTKTLQFPDITVQGPSTSLALLSSAFILLTIYLLRRLLFNLDDPNLRLSAASGYRKLPFAGYRVPIIAIFSFFLFILFFADYIAASLSGAYDPRNFDRHLVLGILEYALLFALATFSFSLLAASEYMKQVSRLESELSRGWPYLESGMNALYQRLPPEERTYFNKLVIVSESRTEEAGQRFLSIHAKSRMSPKYREFKITINEKQYVVSYEIVGRE